MRTLNYIYATRYGGKFHISLDLLLPDSSNTDSHPLPVLVWFHGGGLIQGSRNKVPPHITRAVDSHNVAIVVPDYRLAPQCRASLILDDISDLLAFTFDTLPAKLPPSEPRLDLDRVLLSGSSAGGWLALLLGLSMCPGSRQDLLARIRGIACIYPITTMDHPFFLEPRVPFLGSLANPPSDYAAYVDPNAPVTANTSADRQRASFYMHAQREGIFPQLLFTDTQRKQQGWLQRTDVPLHVLQVDDSTKKAWPPIYVIHGALDTAVDVDQARKLKAALEQAGIPLTYDEMPDKDHMWDEFEPQEDMPSFWKFVVDRLSAATEDASASKI